MRNMKRRSKIYLGILVAAVVVFTMIAFFPVASAEPAENDIEVMSSEAVILDTNPSGDIEKVRVVTFFGLTGDGSADVSKEKTLEGDVKWQGVHGFTTPTLEGDTLVWRGLDVDGFRNVMSSTEIKADGIVREVRMSIPLKLHYIYEWNGEIIDDPNEVTGQDGHFRVSLVMENTSAEKTVLEYEDPETGQIKTEEVETYLPLVILPYDWYFYNDTFFNLEADPTGVVVPLPGYYQVGWSIPLFPPASEAENMIWVEADVKNFAMPPLVISANFIFPQTNQRDTLPEFVAGLEMLFDGVKQIKDGLGSTDAENTLLYGANAIADGLQQMADGLPEAQAGLDTQLIPGVDQAIAGIGSPGTEQTLQWGVNEASKGLMQMLGGLGGPAVENTLLFAMDAMSAGLEQMSAGIGSADTPDTLLYGVDQTTSGLQQMVQGIGDAAMQNTLLYAMNAMGGGLEEMKAGIGSPATVNTLLYAMAAMGGGLQDAQAGIGSATTPNTLLYAMAAMADGLNTMLAGIGSEGIPDTLLYGIDQVSKGISSGSASEPGLLEGIQEIQGGLVEMYDATSTSGEIWQATNLIRILAPWTGPIVDQLEQGLILGTGDPANPSMHEGLGLMLDGTSQMISGIGSPSTPDTLLYGTSQIQGGLQQMAEGIGGAGETLLYAVAQVQGGLQQIKDGIGAAAIPDTLLFAVDQVQIGLNSILAGIGTPVSQDTLLYAVAQVQSGLELMKAGIGSANAGNTLLYAMSAMTGGLNEMKAGIGTESMANTLMYAAAQVENGLDLMKTGIGAEGAPDTLLFAMASVQNGLQQLKTGLASGNPNDPGLKEGLMLISEGLGDAVAGLGSTSTPDTLLYGADQVEAGLTRMSEEGINVMFAGLAENLASLYLTEAQLEAITIRGEEFDHIMGRTNDAENKLTFIYQTPPTYNYTDGSKMSWVVAGALSAVAILALLFISLLLRKKPVIG